MRTKEQHEKEKNLVTEIKKLDQRIKKEEKEERNFRKLIYDETSFAIPPQINNAQFENIGGVVSGNLAAAEANLNESNIQGGRRDRGSGVYLRSQVLQAPLPTNKEHLQKKFEIILAEIDIDPLELPPTQKVSEFY